jgi:hypothetical protein
MKIRAIVNGVSYYTTSAAIRGKRSSDFSLQNDALAYCLHCMASSDGFATTVRYYDHKMQQQKFDVQLSKMV